MIDLYEELDIGPNLPKRDLEFESGVALGIHGNDKFNDGGPTPKNIAAHVLSHPQVRKVYDSIRSSPQVLEDFVRNASEKIKDGWITNWRIGASTGLAVGLAGGMVIGGLVLHPEISMGHFQKLIDGANYDPRNYNDLSYRFVVATTVLGGVGSIVGASLGGMYGKMRQAVDTRRLTLDSEAYRKLLVRQKNFRRRLKKTAVAVTGFALITGLADNAKRTLNYMGQNRQNAGYTQHYEPERGTNSYLPSEQKILEVKVSDLMKGESAGYQPQAGEFLYGVACGEGIPVGKNGFLLPTKDIPYGNFNLRDQFLADNLQITDVNKIPVDKTIRVRDVNGDGKIRFVIDPTWECREYTSPVKK